MRSHKAIIDAAGGHHDLAAKIGPFVEPGHPEKLKKRIRAWWRENSIPGEYWPLLARLRVASLTELAGAAEARKLPELAAGRAEAA